MMPMAYGIATREWKGWIDCVASWNDTASKLYPSYVVFGQDILPAYQRIHSRAEEPIIAFIHDDVVIYETHWDLRVLKEFEDERVGIVGFGGALQHGSADLYTSPYRLPNLARGSFMSNMQSAAKHGSRFTGSRDVAVLDGFSLFVRRSILDQIGGWNATAGYYLYTEALCCEARRLGYRLRLVGVDCEHYGGKTSTVANVTEDFEGVHRWLWENYRDVLPAAVA